MGRRKKKTPEEERKLPSTGEVRTSLRALLKDVVVQEASDRPPRAAPTPKKEPRRAAPTHEARAVPATSTGRPSDALRGEDRIAYWDAYAGVIPLRRGRPEPAATKPPPVEPPARSPYDEEARARLAALVAGGVRFDIERDGDEIRGVRVGTPPHVLRELLGARPEATLDLHGMRADRAEQEVVRFVRAQQRRGARRVCIVHGKGLHSPGGVGVLRDAALHALTEGGAAPVVLAFATASSELGGSGALLVELTRR
ncbi:MAG TPA: Smr/MutS family protein [Sandaracinaceae bacterium]